MTIRSLCARDTLGCLLTALIAACSAEPQGAPLQLEAFRLDSGITLQTVVVHDTINVGDMVRVWVVLENGGAPAEINNHPDRLEVKLENQSGQRVEPFDVVSIDDFLGGKAHFVLPRGAIFGQLINLDCISDGYGPRQGGCYSRYRFRSPGTYQIIIRFSGLEGDPKQRAVLTDTSTVVVQN